MPQFLPDATPQAAAHTTFSVFPRSWVPGSASILSFLPFCPRPHLSTSALSRFPFRLSPCPSPPALYSVLTLHCGFAAFHTLPRHLSLDPSLSSYFIKLCVGMEHWTLFHTKEWVADTIKLGVGMEHWTLLHTKEWVADTIKLSVGMAHWTLFHTKEWVADTLPFQL